jgi:hypothetical protein
MPRLEVSGQARAEAHDCRGVGFDPVDRIPLWDAGSQVSRLMNE